MEEALDDMSFADLDVDDALWLLNDNGSVAQRLVNKILAKQR